MFVSSVQTQGHSVLRGVWVVMGWTKGGQGQRVLDTWWLILDSILNDELRLRCLNPLPPIDIPLPSSCSSPPPRQRVWLTTWSTQLLPWLDLGLALQGTPCGEAGWSHFVSSLSLPLTCSVVKGGMGHPSLSFFSSPKWQSAQEKNGASPNWNTISKQDQSCPSKLSKCLNLDLQAELYAEGKQTLREARQDQEGTAGLRGNTAEASAWVDTTVSNFKSTLP